MNLLTILSNSGADTATEITLSLWEKMAALTLFGGTIWMIVVATIFLIAIFWSDYSENGFAITFSFGAILALFYFWGSAPLWEVFPLFSWKFLALYFSIGIGYAVMKTFLYFKKKAKNRFSGKTQEEIWSDTKYDLKGNVFRWWFAWPVSLIVWIVGDLVADVFSAIWTRIKGVFEKVAKAGINAGMNSKND